MDSKEIKSSDWYCPKCGKHNDADNVFCIYCGTPKTSEPVEYNPVMENESYNNENGVKTSYQPKESTKNNTAIIIVAIICATLIIGMVLYFVMFADKSDNAAEDANTGSNTEESIDDYDDYEDESESKNTYSAYVDDYGYEVGYSYFVTQNLRVREGPGKEYRILDRDELSADDYEISVDSKSTTDALIEEGEIVTCMGMQDNWMRIESGWICVYDKGERLVS